MSEPGSKASLLIPSKMVFPWHQAASQIKIIFCNLKILVNQFEEKPHFYVIVSKYPLHLTFVLLKLFPGDSSFFSYTGTEINVEKDPSKELRARKNWVWFFIGKMRKLKPRKVKWLAQCHTVSYGPRWAEVQVSACSPSLSLWCATPILSNMT